jgi:LacI family transcriptional regulator
MPVSNRVTLREIASRLGVSHVTVSLALKDSARISKDRREEVQKLARKMGYRPDPILSSLVVYRQNKNPPKIQSSIAWVNHWDNPNQWRSVRKFKAYWKGASRAAERFGYRLDEVIWKPEFTGQRFETILKTRNVHGILIPPHPSQPDWGGFHWGDFSVVRFGLSVGRPSSHAVMADHHQSTVMAVEKIHSYGYSRIGFVMPRDFDLRSGGSYTGGFVAAQQMLRLRHALPPLVCDGAGRAQEFARIFRHWLDKHKPDAILAADARVLPALKQFDLRVPEDAAVATVALCDTPAVAGVENNSEEIGRVAVETLIALINANETGAPAIPLRVLVAGTWVDGAALPNRNAKVLSRLETT